MRSRRFLTVIWIYFVGNTTATNLSAATRMKDSVDTAIVASTVKVQIVQRTSPTHPWTINAVEPLIWSRIARGKWTMENKKSEAAMLAIKRLIVIFDFKEAKIRRKFPTSEAIKRMLSMVAKHIMLAILSIGSKHVPFWTLRFWNSSSIRDVVELLLASITVFEDGRIRSEIIRWTCQRALIRTMFNLLQIAKRSRAEFNNERMTAISDKCRNHRFKFLSFFLILILICFISVRYFVSVLC